MVLRLARPKELKNALVSVSRAAFPCVWPAAAPLVSMRVRLMSDACPSRGAQLGRFRGPRRRRAVEPRDRRRRRDRAHRAAPQP
eukprot:4825714-Pleurochrysis_carterae.AAC.7